MNRNDTPNLGSRYREEEHRNDVSDVWSRYREAKEFAFAQKDKEGRQEEEKLSLEELEKAIAEAAASIGIPETGMPPRSVVHPSQQKQLTQWFYRVLLILFAGLVIGLVWWGRKMYG